MQSVNFRENTDYLEEPATLNPFDGDSLTEDMRVATKLPTPESLHQDDEAIRIGDLICRREAATQEGCYLEHLAEASRDHRGIDPFNASRQLCLDLGGGQGTSGTEGVRRPQPRVEVRDGSRQ